ncbi:MAG: DMT family transporter [Chitinophagaceae bacterium]|nr:DMT family transporter [Chitinophagaceae bacterium]
MNSSEHIKGLVAINIAAVIFGSAALYGKLNVSPLWIVAVRAVFASIALFAVRSIRKESQTSAANSRLTPHASRLILTGGILSLHWLTFFYSVQLSGVAIATLTFAAFPLFTLILEAVMHRKHLTATNIGAGVLIIVAVALLVRIDKGAPAIVWGAVLGLLSAVLFALFGVISKTLTTRLTTISVSFYQNIIVFVLLLPFLPFSAPLPDEPIEWLFLALLGIITTALMHQLYLYALKRLSASTCSGFVALEPVYAILFAALFFAEPVTATVIISGVLIFVASFLILKL